jgi:hypothetical protein
MYIIYIHRRVNTKKASLIGKFATTFVNIKSINGKRYLILHDKGKGKMLKVNVRVKFTLEKAMKAHRKSSTLSFTLTIDEGVWLTPHSIRFTTGKETRSPIHRRLGGSRGRSGQVRKNSHQPGFDVRIV